MSDKKSATVQTLKDVRESHFLTQSELAEQINVSIQSISYWERGLRKPHLMYQRRLAKIFGADTVNKITWYQRRG